MSGKAFHLKTFYTAIHGNVGSALIRMVSGPFSHVGLVVDPPPDGISGIEEMVYYESIWKEKGNGKNGVRGPIPVERLYGWLIDENAAFAPDWQPYGLHSVYAKGKKGRLLCMQDVPPRPNQTERTIKQLNDAVEKVEYASYQTVVQQALHQLLGWNRPHWARSPGKWNCAEMVARVLSPDIQMRGFQAGDKLFDTFTPWNIYEGLDRYWHITEAASSA